MAEIVDVMRASPCLVDGLQSDDPDQDVNYLYHLFPLSYFGLCSVPNYVKKGKVGEIGRLFSHAPCRTVFFSLLLFLFEDLVFFLAFFTHNRILLRFLTFADGGKYRKRF